MTRSWMNRIERKLRNLAARALLHRVSYREKVRLLQIETWPGDPRDGVEHAESYGFTSHPLPGAEPITLNLAGNSGRAIVILVNDRRHRIEVAEGQTALYTANGEVVKLDNNGQILLASATRVLLDTPLAEFSQDVKVRGSMQIDGDNVIGGSADIGEDVVVDGSIDSGGDQVAGGISTMNHKTTGVTPGSGVSGLPQ